MLARIGTFSSMVTISKKAFYVIFNKYTFFIQKKGSLTNKLAQKNING